MSFLLCSGAGWTEDAGRIKGCLTNDSGVSLPGVEVRISGTPLSEPLTIYTDSSGCYQASTRPGSYQIQFRLTGFMPDLKREVIVFSGRDAIVDQSLRISIQTEMVVTARKPLRDLVEESDNLLGVADAASQGAVRYEQLALRPLLRPGELLETVPGVIISQHSGQGKANQYYLRGFNLDHGTDLAIILDDMPVNFPTHGHGQGYSDLSFLIPELVNDVQYQKGPYYAEVGDFSSAGAVRIDYARSLDKTVAGVEAGSFEYGRGIFLSSTKAGNGRILLGLELFHNNGPWKQPDDYRKASALFRYTVENSKDSFSLMAMGYEGSWNSTDQIPLRTINSGTLDRFGTVDSTDGGDSGRYSVSADWRHAWKDAITESTAYVIRYDLKLFSNFTYFLDDPVNGDQFEQVDRRTTAGGQILHRWLGRLGDFDTENQAGFQFRNDDIGLVGLYHTKERQRLSTTREDQVDQRSWSGYWQSTIRWSSYLRTLFGLRADYYQFGVDSNITVNSGKENDTIVSPKLGIVLGPWSRTEFYANLGYGFHSNDARGTTIRVNPVTLEPADRVDPLVRSRGVESGLRTTLFKNWQTTFSLWQIDLDSELLFVGDAGITEPSRPSRRTGFEWNNRLKPYTWMMVEMNWAYSRSRFRDFDPAGDRIPGAIEGAFTAGIWFEGLPVNPSPLQHTVGVIQSKNTSPAIGNSFWSKIILGLQLRYFGPRPLIEDNSVRSVSSTLANLAIGYSINKRWNAFVDLFNLLDSKSSDIDYFYTSRLSDEPEGGIEDIHTHPVEPFAIRFSLTTNF